GETNRPARTKAWPVLQPHPCLGNDPEDPLRTDKEPVRAGAGSGPRQAAGLDYTTRRDHPQAFNEIVDMRVETGKMAARAGRDPAAQGRVFKALREMPQGQPMRLELSLERRTKHAGLDACCPRGPIDFQHTVEMPQVESDRALVRTPVEPWLDPANHT